MALSTSKQLLEALILLREDESKVQKELARRIKSRKVKADKPKPVVEDDEEKGGDEGGEDDAGDDLFGGDDTSDDDAGGDDAGDDTGGDDEAAAEDSQDDASADEKEDSGNGKLAGADELIDTPQELPQVLKGNDFIDKINKIRAGASLNDKEVQTKIISYVKSLTTDERDDLWVNLDSLARIILGGLDPAQVLTPSLVTGPNRQKKSTVKQNSQVNKKDEKQPPGANLPIVTPVTSLGEGVKKKLSEVPFVLKSNKTVPFGHTAHIRDLERMLSDLLRFRSCQERGSESYMSVSLAIKTLKGQLALANRKSIGNKVSIDGASIRSIPALIEQD